MAVGTTILACLLDYIGLRGCGTAEPGSGLFINDLPGISSELIQEITEAEEQTYLATWNNIQRQSILMFRSQLLSQVNQCYQVNKMATIECLACENRELLSVSLWYLLGHQTMVWALNNWNNSRFSTVDRQSVEEIKDHFFNMFENELSAAVQGIDIEQSDCIENEKTCLQQNGRIHYRDSLM